MSSVEIRLGKSKTIELTEKDEIIEEIPFYKVLKERHSKLRKEKRKIFQD